MPAASRGLPPAPAPLHDPDKRADTARMGMWVFLTTEVLFFGVLFTGYAYSRMRMPAAFAEASLRTDLAMGTLETAVLLTSSLLMALAVSRMRAGDTVGAVRRMAATASLGVLFCVIHFIEYAHDSLEHLLPTASFAAADFHYPGARLFFFLYFGMTGFHVLHVLIGVALITILAVMYRKGPASRHRHTVLEVVGLYWHFVDIVWVYLYPLFYLVSVRGHA